MKIQRISSVVAMMMMFAIGLIESVDVKVISAQEKLEKEREKENNMVVEKTCKNTPHYDLCMKVLTADPKSKTTAEVQELGLIVVAEIKNKSLEIIDKITKTKAAAKTKLKTALTECHNKYNAVIVGDVPVAERAMWGNPKFAENAVADVKIEALGCEQAFQIQGVSPSPSPFTKENKYIADVADVARGIVRNLL